MTDIVLDSATRLQRAFFVRKRKSGGQTFLICLASIVEIDGFTEALWDRCRERITLHRLTAEMASIYRQVEPMKVLELIAHNVIVLSSARFLQILGDDRTDAATRASC